MCISNIQKSPCKWYWKPSATVQDTFTFNFIQPWPTQQLQALYLLTFLYHKTQIVLYWRTDISQTKYVAILGTLFIPNMILVRSQFTVHRKLHRVETDFLVRAINFNLRFMKVGFNRYTPILLNKLGYNPSLESDESSPHSISFVYPF
jgi:hypothetical protein